MASGAYDGPDDFVAGPFEVARLLRGGAEFVRARRVTRAAGGPQTVEVIKS